MGQQGSGWLGWKLWGEGRVKHRWAGPEAAEVGVLVQPSGQEAMDVG